MYFLETVASPCKNRDDASRPLVDVDVTLLLKTTGPLNSEIILPSRYVSLSQVANPVRLRIQKRMASVA